MLILPTPLDYFKKRQSEHWFLNCDRVTFEQTIQDFTTQLKSATKPLKILLAEPNPVRFCAAFMVAVTANQPLFLGNPTWGQQEWQQALDLIQPDIIWSPLAFPLSPKNHQQMPSLPPQAIMIATGGTSGKLKFAIHTWQTLIASASGFYHYFDKQPVNSLCVLPLYHVSGLMQFVRALVSGGIFLELPYKSLKSGDFPSLNFNQFFISLVPTQLQFLLQHYPEQLVQFKTILLGGAPAWSSLLDQARKHNIPVALTYGMTETASQVVTLKPQDFLAGNNSNGKALNHAKLAILDNQKVGIITLEAQSLYRGYYPHLEASNRLITDDLGYFDSQGYLYIVGRNSTKIISGGENVFPAEVEAAILATQMVKDACVVGLEDEKWGQIVTAVYVAIAADFSLEQLKQKLRDRLAPFKQPKQWLEVPTLPRNAQGKINYAQVQKIAATALKSP
jgi:O-succinylbenzoic acid--CoA ligase